MTVWRYTAVDLKGSDRVRRRGELAGDTAAEVRASLRRIGLQVIDLKPLRSSLLTTSFKFHLFTQLMEAFYQHLRKRRQLLRAELYDSLATMLESGVPLLESIETLARSANQNRGIRSMLLQVHQSLHSGDSSGSISSALIEHPGWFDQVEAAMVQAAQHSGTLPEVLRTLSNRQQRASALMRRLTGALTYPFIVFLVGIGVVIFLSVKTLPTLAQILHEAQIAPPTLTKAVMSVGQVLVHYGLFIGVGVIILFILLIILRGWIRNNSNMWGGVVQRLQPRVLRRIAVAQVMAQLAELIRSGVPLVDALRVLAPVASSGGLRTFLVTAAQRVEGGEDFADTLDQELYFDEEFRRLVIIGQTTGELDALLQRLSERYERQAHRLIDRLTTLLEPTVILLLAALVGLVVMATILPLLRIQEVL